MGLIIYSAYSPPKQIGVALGNMDYPCFIFVLAEPQGLTKQQSMKALTERAYF